MYVKKSKSNLLKIKESLEKEYNEFKKQNLNLDMSRGKPCQEQLELSNEMLNINSIKSNSGIDLRNYGGIDGTPESKEFFSKLMDVDKSELIIGGNSSLNLMHDSVMRSMLLGVYGGGKPWRKDEKIKFLCPSPGYDRHFAICELFGIEMITVGMNDNGPDIEKVEKLVKNDDKIKGIWCVPMYSNPEGITYSDEVVKRFAKLEPKAKDFRVFWDNAYAFHHLHDDKKDSLRNILKECKKNGTEDMVYMFASTSKITFAGCGIALMVASKNNIEFIKKQISIQTIGPDKINQDRHVKFLKNANGLEQHMKKHADIIRPKFEKVLNILGNELEHEEIAKWTKPRGGYFISFNTMQGCAKKVVKMTRDAGVILTGAGATFPYFKDIQDRNIRIAPTFPPIEELESALKLFCICVKIVSINKLLEQE